MPIHHGSCHCGAIRFRIELADDERDVLDCNCSICAKKALLHLFVPRDRFTLLAGEDQLASYTFGTHVAKHMFCRTCGIHPFYRARSHPDDWDVNVRCLDDVPLAHWRIQPFDGANWEKAAAAIDAPGLTDP
jgi:hypothetical protein